jgi:AraC family transcriptional regulator of adaptative response/methylated-DNA-[protein]-cysteine methyltransferase
MGIMQGKPILQPAYAGDDARWEAVARRDRGADGHFYYSVRTTGVYCRPSCAARLPLRKNVAFHATREAAERAGFRPCKRCKPDRGGIEALHAAGVAAASQLIERSDQLPSLDALAAAAGMSRYHFHRVFKAATGLTPRAYAAAHRARRVREHLRQGDSVTQALYGAGFNSSGRFYANAGENLGMTPSRFRAGGAGETIRFAVGECSLGAILVAATARGLCAVSLGDEPQALVEELQDRFPKARLVGGDREFEHWVARVVGFVESPRIGLDLPLDIRGTAFQQRVWQALREVPPGHTVSYAQVARRIGAPAAVRAVAQACGANAIAVAIPCHRVVRNDGNLSGYRWGVERKRALLDKERAPLPQRARES